MQLLLNPSGIAIPDSYLFTVPFLNHDIRSLLEISIRLKKFTLFERDGLRTISEIHEKRRPLGAAGRDGMAWLASVLDPFSNDIIFRPWPSDMGAKFAELVDANLCISPEALEARAGKSPEAIKFVRSIELFQDAIEKAKKQREKDCAENNAPYSGDIRQNEILINLTSIISKGQHIANNYTSAMKIVNLIDTDQRSTIIDGMKLLSALYERNWGMHAGISVDRAGRSEWFDAFCLGGREAFFDFTPLEPVKVRLPTSAHLSGMSSRKLEALMGRRGDYEAAFRQLIDSDSEVDVHERFLHYVEELRAYAGLICEASGVVDRNNTFLVGAISSEREAFLKSPQKTGARWAATLSPTALDFFAGAGVGTLLSVGFGLGWWAIKVRGETERIEVKVGIDANNSG